MKHPSLLALPAMCALVLAVGGAASAAPVVHDPLVTLAGSAPTAVVAGANGRFFVLNSGLDSVIEYDATGQQHGAKATALLPSGAKSSAMLSDEFGSLYVAHPGTHSVSRVNVSTGMITPFAMPAVDVPVALAISSTRDVFVTKQNDEVMRITPTDMVTLTFAKLPAGSDPRGVVTDAAGNVYTANHGSNTISKISAAGTVSEYAALGAGSGPVALTITPKGILFVANQSSDTIVSFDTAKPAGSAPLAVRALPRGAAPTALVRDEFDDVFVADTGLNAISVIVPGETTPRTVYNAARTGPVALAISSDNKLLFASKGADAVSSIDLETKIDTSTIGPLTVGTAFTGTAAATGVGGITFSSPDLPAWLKLDPATGALTGTPTTSGTSSFTLRALSSIGRSDARTVTFDVAAAQVTPTPTATPGPTATGGASGQGAGTGTGAGAGTGSGTGSHGTGALASTGAEDATPWALSGAIITLLGLAVLAASARRRARQNV